METLGNQIQQNSAIKFYCCFCNYGTSRKCNYDSHIISTRHKKKACSETNGNQIQQNSAKKYSCLNCNYETNKKSNYDYHIKTYRHIKSLDKFSENQQKISENQRKLFKCNNCNMEYKNRGGLWKHKQQCIQNEKVNNNSNLLPLVLELVKQNTDFKEFLVEQNKYIVEQNTSLQNHLFEISKEKSMNNCNNTTNNNNHFNLQLFLNETCKNAMNINEFIEQINVSLSDLENTGRLGYVEGITRIFVKGLKELEVNQRPIHCSDGKRETLYIKDGNTWEKDDINKTRLTTAIKKVAHKNIRKITDWVNVHPNCKDSESNKNDLYLKIVSNSMSGGTDAEAEENYNKIKRNIIKEVVIDK
jgi:hypothetical protein